MRVIGCLVRELFMKLQSFTQIFVLLLELEQLSVHTVNGLRLLLNGFSQRQVALQHLLHHVHCVDNSLCNGIFGFICSRHIHPIDRCNRLQSLTFLLKILINVVSILDESISHLCQFVWVITNQRLIITHELLCLIQLSFVSFLSDCRLYSEYGL